MNVPERVLAPIARHDIRRELALLVAALLAATLLATSCGQEKKAQTKTSPVVAVVVAARGDFQYLQAGSDQWLAGSANTYFFVDDRLRTGAGSDLMLAFATGAMAQVNRNTDIKLTSASGKAPGMQIERGNIYLEDTHSLKGAELKTPSAVAAAIGTGMDIKVDPGGSSTLTVTKGTVRFGNEAGRVTVRASEKSVAARGLPPTPPAQVDTNGLGGLDFGTFAQILVEPYFNGADTRDDTESEAAGNISVDPLDRWSHLNLARARLDAGDVPRATLEFNKALELDPQFSQAFAGLGKISLMQGRWEETRGYYERALRADRNSLEAASGLGQAALGEGDLKEAVRLYREALRIETGDADTWVALGLAVFLQGDPDGATDDFKHAISLGSPPASAYRNLGTVSLLRRHVDEAESYFKSALEVDPRDYRLWNSAGCNRVRVRDFDVATRNFNQVEGSPEIWLRAVALQNQGVVEYLRGNYSDAAGAFQKSIELESNREPAFLDLGVTRIALGEYGPALEAFGKAVQLDPADSSASVGIGNAYDRKEEFAAAIAAYRQAIELDPSRGDAWFFLAGDLERTGDRAGAIGAYQKAVEVSASMEEWKKFHDEAAQKLQNLR